MPLYEFACAKCSGSFEELVASTRETPKVTCPQCGSTEVRKRVSTFASRVGRPAAESACATGGCCPNGSCGL